jgi:hypothetical protein
MGRLIAGIVLVGSVLMPASSSSSSGQSSLSQLSQVQASSGGSAKTGSANCSVKAPMELGGGSLCADSGYRATNTFTFANWGGSKYPKDALDGQEFVALFGQSNVCVAATGDVCELTKGAKAQFDKLSGLLTNGRCEGIVVLNAMVAAGVIPPSALQTGASGASALSPNNRSLVAQINFWWETQFSSKVLKASDDIRKQGLKKIVAQLGVHLSRGLFATIGIYTKTAGHALLPVGLTREPSGVYDVIVYDSNMPGKLSRIQIDTDKDQWTYAMGAASPQQPPTKWTGKSGTLDMTTMASRMDVGNCDFCKDKSPSGFKVSAAPLTVPSSGDVSGKLGG